MDFEVDRSDLHRTRTVESPERPITDSEARVRIDAFALTSNNITYAVLGDALQYWNFFPAAAASDDDTARWGRIPVWGFGDVVESRADGIDEGRRIYGYLPMSTDLVIAPGRIDPRGCTDLAAHRSAMASAYNRYVFVDADPAYEKSREEQRMLLWPLFFTSFLIDDFLADNDMFGGGTVVLSSASSKTASSAAFLLRARTGVDVIGLTSARNLEFVEGLGCYDRVLTYDAIAELPAGDGILVDIAGNRDVQAAVHRHFGERLAHSMIVGDTHWNHEAADTATLIGPAPVFFFAPTQVAKRTKDWGQAELDARIGAAWSRYVPWTDTWMEIRYSRGAAAVERAYRELLDGRTDPRTGHICTLNVGG